MIVLTVVVVVKVVPVGDKPDETPIKPDHGDSEMVDDSEIAAVVGNKVITIKALHQALVQNYGEDMLNKLMLRQAIDLETDAYGLAVTDEEIREELNERMAGYGSDFEFYTTMKNQLGMSKQEVLADIKYQLLLEKISIREIYVSDQQIQDYILLHPGDFAPQVHIRIAWIVTGSEQLARLLLEKFEEGESFSDLARRYSEDEFTAASGGDLGLVEARDPFIEEKVLKTANSMAVGAVAGPIAVSQGFAVIQLQERQEETELDYNRQKERARRQIALAESSPLSEVESSLLHKYAATVY
ncbi:peptidylprolyl isomerase [Paenibacillus roseus]